MRPALSLLAALLAPVAAADVQPEAGMLRWPDVSATHICFVYANDIWIVPRAGGVATPLASPPGQESFPRFSPDGQSIAFVGNYDGNKDLYVIPVTGGLPARATHHPASETLSDWTPDGRLIFITNGFAGLTRQSQLFTVDQRGGLPVQMPVPYGGFGSVSADGTWLAYTPHSTDNRTWKRYRGGMATDVWLFNLKDNTSRRITDWEGTDTIPMWIPGGDAQTVYYLSDNGPEHRLNIWSFNLRSGARRQVTQHKDWDVRWPSAGPGPRGRGEIVFQLGSELRLLDLANARETVVKVTIPGDRPAVRPHSVDAAQNMGGAALSPTAKRVLIEARGDVWSAPAKEGVVRNLTRSDSVFERSPSWSPDGRWVAYFSDEAGEYDLYIRPSDAREPEDKDKKNGAPAPAPAPSAAEPRRLTDLGPGFRYRPGWSPDSRYITFSDNAANLHLVTVESGQTVVIDTDPWSQSLDPTWSHDSRWIAYSRNDEQNGLRCLWLYHVPTATKTRVSTPMFETNSPTFDRKGDYLYFRSNRIVQGPMYSDLDTTFIYAGTEALYLIPLRADVKNPWAPRSDEEEFRKPDDKDKKKDEKPADDKPRDDAPADDGVSGTWEGVAQGQGEDFPATGLPFILNLRVAAGGAATGSVVSGMGSASISTGSFDKATGALRLEFVVNEAQVTLTGTLKDGSGSGEWIAGDAAGTWTATRTAPLSPDDAKADKPAKDDAAKEVKIDLDGFERRAIPLPIPSGNFGGLDVTSDHKLIYVRRGFRGSSEASSIKLFDPADDSKEEKTVTAADNFELSADGKKILVRRGSNLTILDASAGGGKSTTVPTGGMNAVVDPRAEWRQILHDVYRLQRDFFYEPTLHGVDWAGLRDHYMKMLADCSNREDVGYVIAEFISELNVGHAYLQGLGDVESSPSVSVGLLGCEFELVTTDQGSAYRIARIHEGAPWDADARGPLSQHGVDVAAGDFLLAVNGVPVDTARDPWAAFIDTANRPTSLTVCKAPTMTDAASPPRQVVVTPVGSDSGLRFRAWIERNRAYVHEKSGGRVGYIYVPNTGVDGQNELFRQFYGQRHLPALIIDERWNGGGQIPTRFIELLNRPPTNYWARRHGNDWPWPPDAHFGVKCMLINGLAGSGGDMFPWLFKHNGLGQTIGTRTWGGLVGISGNPGLIDGGSISVPTFGFYETDGTWGVEGHGVDPDIEVIDDPALMLGGADPQLDRAIEHMLAELAANPYVAPKRPASPDRKGMGIPPEDR